MNPWEEMHPQVAEMLSTRKLSTITGTYSFEIISPTEVIYHFEPAQEQVSFSWEQSAEMSYLIAAFERTVQVYITLDLHPVLLNNSLFMEHIAVEWVWRRGTVYDFSSANLRELQQLFEERQIEKVDGQWVMYDDCKHGTCFHEECKKEERT